MIVIRDYLDDPYPHILVRSLTYKSVREMVPLEAPEVEVQEGEDTPEPESLEARVLQTVERLKIKESEYEVARGLIKNLKVKEKI